MSSPAVAYARENHPRFLSELKDLLRIPSISTLPENKADCRRAATGCGTRCVSRAARVRSASHVRRTSSTTCSGAALPLARSDPSGEKASARTPCVWPVRVVSNVKSEVRQMRIVWSALPVASMSPSGEKAGASTYPFSSVTRRAGFRSNRSTYRSDCSPGLAQSEKKASACASGDHMTWPSWQCCSGLSAAVTRSLLVSPPLDKSLSDATRISVPSRVNSTHASRLPSGEIATWPKEWPRRTRRSIRPWRRTTGA